MPLHKLKRDFEERRVVLIETLQKNKDSLELSKQHQIYGAIKEIENFLKAIEYQDEQRANGLDFELKGRDSDDEPLAAKASRPLHGLKTRTRAWFETAKSAVHEKVVKKAGHAVKATKHKIKMIRDVAKEVKERSKKEREQKEE